MAHTSTAERSAQEGQAPVVSRMYGKLPAKDVNRARAFYAEMLGLTPKGEHNNHFHYEVGGAYFVLYQSSGAASGTHDQLGLVVEDLEGTVSRMRSKGVTFEEWPGPPGAKVTGGITDMGFMKAAWFKDTEGNLISLVSRWPFGDA